MSRRAALAVAGTLAADAVLHIYWATGLTWPARDNRSLALAVLDADVPFTPDVVLPLAAVLLTAAGLVLARERRGRAGRFGLGLQVATLAVAAGLSVRAVAGVAWAFGLGVDTSTPFYWLNLLLYTPLCIALAVAAIMVARPVRWPGKIALGLPLVLMAALLYGAYGYAPSEQPYPSTVASQYVRTPVARFHYLRQGTGSPVVLLSPGSAWAIAWRDQLTALAGRHTVYVVDLPGQGLTELHDRDFAFDLDSMTRAVGEYLDAMRLPTAVLGGNSWSGGWALAYAQRHPERVDKLVLLAPSGLNRPDPMGWEILKVPAVGELLTNLGYGSRSTVAAGLRGLVVNRERMTEELIDSMWALNTRPDNLRSQYLLERGLDWRVTEAALGTTRQPTLIVWGAQDTVLPVANAARFGQLLPSARVEVLDGCGHALTVDCPERVSTLMGDFLD